MTTGKKPYPGDLSAESLALIQKGKHTPPKRINPKISPFVNKVIKRSMRPAAKKRFPDLDPLLRTLDAHLRIDAQADVRTQIREFVWGDRDDAQRTRPRRSFTKTILTVVVLAAFFGGLGYLAYDRGFYHELFRAQEYGAVRVAARIPKTSKEPDELYLKASLFRDDGEEIPEVEGVSFRFQENPLAETGDFITMESSKVYVPNGSYRLKIQVENQLHWQPFFLEPRSIQRTRPSTVDARVISTDVASPAGLPVNVGIEVTDKYTGEPIRPTAIRYQRNGNWIRWNSLVAAGVESGSVHRFRVEHRDYFPQEYSLLVAPYQTELTLQAALVPLPATLEITSVGQTAQVLLDGRSRYVVGGQNAEYREIPQVIPGDPVTLSVAPATYQLSASVGRTEALATEVSLGPGETTQVQITFNPDTRTIDISATQ
jgi:serine/threonine-protein kinase